MYAESINTFIQQNWINLKISKLRELQDTIDGLTDDILLDICLGKAYFVDVQSSIDLEYNDLESLDLQEYSVTSINCKFKSRLDDIVSSIVGYSYGLYHCSEECIDKTDIDIHDSSDVSRYLFYVIDACAKYNSLFSEFDLFVKLVGEDWGFKLNQDDSLIRAILDIKHERAEDKFTRCTSSETAVLRKQVPTPIYEDLNFEPLHAVNRLTLDNNMAALGSLQISGSNGLYYLPEHRKAQKDTYAAKVNKTIPDDIVKSVWNSGWIAPDGTFYGCPDLQHVEFDDLLYEKIKTPESDAETIGIFTNGRRIELLGYIKLSEGRWLLPYPEFIPTREQLQAIIKCQKEKYKTTRVYYGNGFLGLDVIESKLNNKEIYPDEN
nr:MAG TPA: hypothetical protein [Caudoviricetes sp.]